MSYLTQSHISENSAMRSRVAQAAEVENAPGDSDGWVWEHRREWAAAPGWDAAWEYALNTHTPVEGEPPYDPGADEAVITDGMILSQVQAMLAPPPPPDVINPTKSKKG